MIITQIRSALWRAKIPILTVAATYFVSVAIGIVMVHSGNQFALSYRDNLVAKAHAGVILNQKSQLSKGLADFGGNSIGAAADTLGGFGIIFPYPVVAYRGWVGGIVSVDSDHISRLIHPKQAFYYFSVVFMQLLAYSLAAGAGIQAGLSMFRSRLKNAGFMWFGIPREALRDILWIYCLVLPIFLIASLWEFLSPWN
ncbi:MAG: hypothetical protein WC788_00365 [Candidatus Paceibacterota bacterium]